MQFSRNGQKKRRNSTSKTAQDNQSRSRKQSNESDGADIQRSRTESIEQSSSKTEIGDSINEQDNNQSINSPIKSSLNQPQIKLEDNDQKNDDQGLDLDIEEEVKSGQNDLLEQKISSSLDASSGNKTLQRQYIPQVVGDKARSLINSMQGSFNNREVIMAGAVKDMKRLNGALQASMNDYLSFPKRKAGYSKDDISSLEKKLQKIQENHQKLDDYVFDNGSNIKNIKDFENKKKVYKKHSDDLRTELNKLSENIPESILEVNIDRRLNWDRENAAKVMTGGVQPTLDRQNDANSQVWFQTLFGSDNGKLSKIAKEMKLTEKEFQKQQDILEEQQKFLRRYFFSVASLGAKGGNQKTGKYEDLEKFRAANGDQVALASLASGGGLFGFHSTGNGVGKGLNEFIYGGLPESLPDLPETGWTKGNALIKKGRLGTFKRNATHGSKFDDDKIKETDVKTGKDGWLGINIPIGGTGQSLKTIKGSIAVTGFQGQSTDGSDQFQTGSVLYKHYLHPGNRTNTLIGFEGSAPHTTNIFGGSHGAKATFNKKILGKKSSQTLTGQGKRSKWGVKDSEGKTIEGKGGRIAKVDSDGLKKLKRQWDLFEKLNDEDQKTFFKKLLLTTGQGQRNDLLGSLSSFDPEELSGKKRNRRNSADNSDADSNQVLDNKYDDDDSEIQDDEKPLDPVPPVDNIASEQDEQKQLFDELVENANENANENDEAKEELDDDNNDDDTARDDDVTVRRKLSTAL